MKTLGFLAAMLLTSVSVVLADSPRLPSGMWRAWLESPGGELPFGLQLVEDKGRWSGAILNGAERIEIPVVELKEGTLTLGIPYYDSSIVAKVSANGARLDGEWKKRSKGDRWVKMVFHATVGVTDRFPPGPGWSESCRVADRVAGRWSVLFADVPAPAVGVLLPSDDGTAGGTILTTTGDYRFLAGTACLESRDAGGSVVYLRLSTFDGAHAFLFLARTTDGGSLQGDFWSGDSYHDTWTAKRDPDAELPDAFTLTQAMESARLDEVVFPDLDGKRRSLADAKFAGKARIVEIFGTWCPNCNDASQYLVELHKKYKDKGLSILGLAFEYSGDFARDAGQVRTFAAHHKIEYPILLAGTSDREKASASLPIIDKLRAYPTLLVLDRNNKIAATYTGFSGPAAGEEHQRFRERFEALIDKLLAE